MTIEIGFLWVAQLIMIGALVCFLRAFALRKIDLSRHMFWGKLGALLVLAGLLAVELAIRVLGWEFPQRSTTAFHLHLAAASGATVLLIAIVITGLRRQRNIHIRLYPFFLPLYTATIVLSWFAFQLW
jgi:uncharacterized membrane protein